MERYTWNNFIDKYKFEEGDIRSDEDRIKELVDKHGSQAWRYVWTMCCEGSDEYYVAGFAKVNRMGYMIATVPHDVKEGDYDTVEIVADYEELISRVRKPDSYHFETDLMIEGHPAKVEIFAEKNGDGNVWYSLIINVEVLETSEYWQWTCDDEEDLGEFNFNKLVETTLRDNDFDNKLGD